MIDKIDPNKLANYRLPGKNEHSQGKSFVTLACLVFSPTQTQLS